MFWYLMGWMFFSFNFKKSKAGFDEIVELLLGDETESLK